MKTSPTLIGSVAQGSTFPGSLTAARGWLSRVQYFRVLTIAFTVFNGLRVFAYLPTMASIAQSGQSDQHSLLTWLNWLGANLTMAAWLYEHNGRRLDRTVMVNLCNATMCALTVGLIAWFRV